MANTTVGTTATAAAAGETAMGVAAEGAAVGVSTLIKACTSWNVILLAIITLLQIFADDIQEWIKSLADAEDAMTDAEKTMKGLLDEIENGSYGLGEAIYKIKEMQKAWDSLADDMEAKKKFVEENRSAFEELGVAVNSVADADALLIDQQKEFIQALKDRAMATAAAKLAAEQYEKAITAQMKREQAERKLSTIPQYVEQKRATISGGGNAAYGYAGKQLVNSDYTAQKELVNRYKKEEEAAMALAESYFNLQNAKEAAANTILDKAGLNATPTPTTPTATTNTKPMSKDDLIALTGGAIDASAEREVLKATLDARTRMTTANAEEREKIERELTEKLNDIEKARLDLTIVNLEAMLESEMLTNEQRLNIEAELIQAKIDLADMEVEKRKEADAEKFKIEEERAKKEKALKDKEAKEEAEREKQVQSVKTNMANAASSIMKQTAELLQENSKEQKALNAAAIAMDTYKAAMAGWTSAQSLPTPFNAIVGTANVAASVAMGATQLKNLLRVASDGSNAEGILSSAQSAPNVASSMPASYTRSLQGDNELTDKDTRVYVVESDITNAQKSARVRVESASF